MGKPCTTTVIGLDLLQESTTTGPKTHANAAGANIDLPQESTTTGPKTHSNAAEAIIDLPQESTTTGPRTPPTAAGESGELAIWRTTRHEDRPNTHFAIATATGRRP